MLTLVENIFELLYPLMIGIAIDGLISRDLLSLLPLVITWLGSFSFGCRAAAL
ncbi:hypothetical protein HC928_14055 [bacterium]|nr:hypothetical protein [bacterium]